MYINKERKTFEILNRENSKKSKHFFNLYKIKKGKEIDKLNI